MRRRIVSVVELVAKWLVGIFPPGLMLASAGLLLLWKCVTGLLSLAGAFGDFLGRVFPSRAKKSRKNGFVERTVVTQLDRLTAMRGRLPASGRLTRVTREVLMRSAGAASVHGRLSIAEAYLRASLRYVPRYSADHVSTLRTLAINQFMQGKFRAALPNVAEVGRTLRLMRSYPGVSSRVRFLAPSWFVAIGHVAMLDFLLKRQQLGWESADTQYLAPIDSEKIFGRLLFAEFEKLGIRLIRPADQAAVYQAVRAPGDREWTQLGTAEQSALVEDFWETVFPNAQGEALFFSHAAAKVQQRWEREGRAPLLAKDAKSSATLLALRRQLGLPDNAWYVCLHVRESGFHGKWNSVYRSARDADIDSYAQAIQYVTERGGWVVRMGDATMKPMPPLAQTIDYARSDHKGEYADILLLSGCRFFVGTNSGLSIIPGIYGVPCVLTNWVPLGMPNWFGRDLMIPKRVVDASGRSLSFAEIIGSDIGFVQNSEHLPEGISFVDNSPSELADVVLQMLDELDQSATLTRDRAAELAFVALAQRLGSYGGSRLGTAFGRQHPELWSEAEAGSLAAINL